MILDYNKFQLDGAVKDILWMEPLAEKWRVFGWDVQEIDGHDVKEVQVALQKAKAITGKPTAIVADTIKGKGVSFMENNNHYHGVAPTPEEMERALKELT
jgi:transketolase